MGAVAAYFVDLTTGEVSPEPRGDDDALVAFVWVEEWLHAIADARGLPRQPLVSAPGYDHDVVVDLSTGKSDAVHMDRIHRSGPPAGYRLQSDLLDLDYLDALREARGLPPCDREAMSAEPDSDFPGP